MNFREVALLCQFRQKFEKSAVNGVFDVSSTSNSSHNSRIEDESVLQI